MPQAASSFPFGDHVLSLIMAQRDDFTFQVRNLIEEVIRDEYGEELEDNPGAYGYTHDHLPVICRRYGKNALITPEGIIFQDDARARAHIYRKEYGRKVLKDAMWCRFEVIITVDAASAYGMEVVRRHGEED